jgi:hypothetical protein
LQAAAVLRVPSLLIRDMDATAIVSYVLFWKLHQSLKVCAKTVAAPVV